MGTRSTSTVAQLRRITERLLNPTTLPAASNDPALELFDLLSDIGGIDVSGDHGTLCLPNGEALSPSDAANCTKDLRRVSVFLHALQDALIEMRRRVSGGRIEVVYAGTGPLAPLAIPLMPLLSPRDVQFTFIDVFSRSTESVAKILRRLRFDAFVRAVVEADATLYRHPHKTPLHIVLTETMQRSLAKEPQVAIMRNTIPQLSRCGMFIPERVTVDLAFGTPPQSAGPASRPVAEITRVGRVADLTAMTALKPIDSRGRLPARNIEIPKDVAGKCAVYQTEVQAFRRHVLHEGDSGLTNPEIVWNFPRVQGGERFAFRYQLGEHPGIVWELLDKVNGPA